MAQAWLQASCGLYNIHLKKTNIKEQNLTNPNFVKGNKLDGFLALPSALSLSRRKQKRPQREKSNFNSLKNTLCVSLSLPSLVSLPCTLHKKV